MLERWEDGDMTDGEYEREIPVTPNILTARGIVIAILFECAAILLAVFGWAAWRAVG